MFNEKLSELEFKVKLQDKQIEHMQMILKNLIVMIDTNWHYFYNKDYESMGLLASGMYVFLLDEYPIGTLFKIKEFHQDNFENYQQRFDLNSSQNLSKKDVEDLIDAHLKQIADIRTRVHGAPEEK